MALDQGRRHHRSWERHVPTTFAGCTTQGVQPNLVLFTLYTCGVLQPVPNYAIHIPTFGFSTWKFCFLFLYSLLLVSLVI